MHEKNTAWLKLACITILLPMLIFWVGGYYLAALERETRFRNFAAEADEMLATMRSIADTEKYLCSTLTAIYNRCKEVADLKAAVESFSRQHRLAIRYLIWHPSGDVYHANFPWTGINGDWRQAYLELRRIANGFYQNYEKNIPAEVMTNLRQIFGPHFFPLFFRNCFSGRDLSLIRPDSAQKYPLTWMNVGERYGLVIFFDYSLLKKTPGLDRMLDSYRGNLHSGYMNNHQVFCADPELAANLQSRIRVMRHRYSDRQDFPNFYIFTNFINENLTGFCAVRKSGIDMPGSDGLTRLIMVFLHLCLIYYAFLSYRVIVGGVRLSLGIRTQLVLLFVVANVLPGFLLLVSGSDYLQQLRAGLLHRAFNKSMTCMQNIDELFNNEYSVQKGRITKALRELRAALQQNLLNRQTISSFIDRQRPAPDMLFITASSTGIIAGDTGIMKNGVIQEAFDHRLKTSPVKTNVMNAIFKLTTFVMASINKTPVSGKQGAEVEFISDGLMQKKPAELVRRFYESGSFWHWGIGQIRHPTYIETFSLFDPALLDYIMLYVWDSRKLELEFVRRIFHDLNRNEDSIRVMAADDLFTTAFPPETLENPRLVEFAGKLRNRTLTRPEFCVINGENFMLAGHKCVHMPTIRLFSLFPIEQIESEIQASRRLIWLLALVSLLISISLGLKVSSGILLPLSALQAGIDELQNRNFSYRLPDLGHDEFGSLASIFNEILGDLEEMHVASIVQEKLMTRMDKPFMTGSLGIYGKTLALAGNGGDYFELISTLNHRPALLLGNVGGTGISRCLLLAFLKSAVMQLHDLTNQPQRFMEELNKLLKQSNAGKEGHEISLQYILCSDNDRLEISNAGMTTPVFIDRNAGTVIPLPMPSLPLAGHEQKIASMQIDLARGCSMILATSASAADFAVSQPTGIALLQTSGTISADAFLAVFTNLYRQTGFALDRDLTIAVISNTSSA